MEVVPVLVVGYDARQCVRGVQWGRRPEPLLVELAEQFAQLIQVALAEEGDAQADHFGFMGAPPDALQGGDRGIEVVDVVSL